MATYANIRLVLQIAKTFRSTARGMGFSDLFSSGVQGLREGLLRYDPDFRKRGDEGREQPYKVSTYVTWWIKQAISRAIINEAAVIRLPVPVHEGMGKMRAALPFLTHELGRQPTTAELAAAAGITHKTAMMAMRAYNAVPLSMPVGEDRDAQLTIGDMIEDVRASDVFEKRVDKLVHTKIVAELLQGLDERSRVIVTHKFGLSEDGVPKTLRDIALLPDVCSQNGKPITWQRVDQLLKQALRDLRAQAERSPELGRIVSELL